MKKLAIIGSGSWSVALASVFRNINLLVKTNDTKRTKKKFKFYKKYLEITDDYKDIVDCNLIFFANPSQNLRKDLKKLPKNINSKFVICCKGVENKTNKLMSEIVDEQFPKNRYAILSGPNFASEVTNLLPTATVLSSKSNKLLQEISEVFMQDKFRTYFNNDIVGTQIGGAMKNIIAIACGAILGKNLGFNAVAAIITRGLSEIIDLGVKMGAKKTTFYGLSGIGDLTLTCSSLKSRNTKLGYMLAQKKKVSTELFEGKESCESVCQLGEKYNLELPVCNAVKQILKGKDINEIATRLLSRPLQFEK